MFSIRGQRPALIGKAALQSTPAGVETSRITANMKLFILARSRLGKLTDINDSLNGPSMASPNASQAAEKNTAHTDFSDNGRQTSSVKSPSACAKSPDSNGRRTMCNLMRGAMKKVRKQ